MRDAKVKTADCTGSHSETQWTEIAEVFEPGRSYSGSAAVGICSAWFLNPSKRILLK